MKTSRRRFLSSTFGASAGLAILGQSAHAAPPSKIRLGTLVPKGSTYFKQLQAMGEKWRDASGGALTLTIYPDGSMGGEAEMVRRMRLGQLQAGLLTAVGLAAIEPAVGGLQNLPLMFRDLDDVDYVGAKLQPMLEKKMEEKGFVVLFWGDAGWVRFFTKKPVRTPDDLAKLKFFCWAGDANQFSLTRDLGLNPVSLETADILPGLKTGLIEAVPMPPFAALAAQVDIAAPNMLALNYAPLVGAAVVSKKVWDSLPEDQRAKMLEAAKATGVEFKRASRSEADEAVAAMQKRGLKVHVPTADEEAAWRKLCEKAYPGIRGKIVPEDVFDEAKKLLDERHQGKAP